jgi:hypothetical protein
MVIIGDTHRGIGTDIVVPLSYVPRKFIGGMWSIRR